jgi:hypothetical protein
MASQGPFLFAAINSAHDKHRMSRRWLESIKADGWGVSTETFLACVRLLRNSQVMRGHALPAPDALRIVRAEFAGADAGEIVSAGLPNDSFLGRVRGHKQIRDFHLVQSAVQHKAKLATRDRGTLSAWPAQTFPVL